MQLNPNILTLGAAVFVFGVVLLVLTYAAEFLLPLIGLAVLGYLVYMIVKTLHDQGMF